MLDTVITTGSAWADEVAQAIADGAGASDRF